MFTGLVQGQGTLAARTDAPGDTRRDAPGGAAGGAAGGDGVGLTLTAPWLAAQVRVGDSVALNGCCLTITEHTTQDLTVHAVPETLRRTTLGGLRIGDRVNLERPLAVGDRLDGHIVQGHVDATGVVRARRAAGDGVELDVGLPADLARYVVEKGSIAVDGVSLTVAVAGDDVFTVALIPHTLAVTTLSDRAPGDRVNLEVDVLAKYVERLLAKAPAEHAPAGAVPANAERPAARPQLADDLAADDLAADAADDLADDLAGDLGDDLAEDSPHPPGGPAGSQAAPGPAPSPAVSPAAAPKEGSA